MPAPELKDYIESPHFNPYVVKKTNELSALYQSGIISHNAELDALAKGGGRLINMPYWEDLSGEDQVATYDSPVTSNTIKAGQDVAVLNMRVQSWKAPDMQGMLSGADPMGAIGGRIAAYWARRMQVILMKMLDGAFGNEADMASNIYKYETFDSTNASQEILKAINKLGDASAKITAVACNSADRLNIDLQNIASNNATYLSNYKGVTDINTRKIIVDDAIPAGTIYLFGEGAIGQGNGLMKKPSEYKRDPDKGVGIDYVYSRQAFILHPRGIAFTKSNYAGLAPTNDELANKANWQRVYEPKDIRIVKMMKNSPGK